MSIAPMYVEAPPVTPLPYGLFSVAVITPETGDHWQMGTQYEPEACGEVFDTLGACQPLPDVDLAISVADTGVATITASGAPTGAYVIDWGDGTTTLSTNPDADTHTYDDPGVFTMSIRGPVGSGYSGSATVTVTDSAASGPFDAVTGKATTTGVPLVDGVPFTVYDLFRCKAPGSIQRGLERARASLRLGEQRAAERVVAGRLPLTDGAVPLPQSGAIHPVDGLAALEQYAGSVYGGVPTLHMSRGTATILSAFGLLKPQTAQSRLETTLGSLVAAGGGYDTLAGPGETPDAAGAGEAWMYATGAVMVRRQAEPVTVDATISTTPATNDFSVLVERPYVVAWECVTAAVLVTSPYTVPDGAP